jgi:hypothetical protein
MMRLFLSNIKLCNLLFMFVILIISFGLIPMRTYADSVNRITSMALDSQNQSAAYSIDPAYTGGGYYSYSWTEQISHGSNPYVMINGGNRMVALLQDGTVLTKNSPYENWITQTTGARWISVGNNGEMMAIDPKLVCMIHGCNKQVGWCKEYSSWRQRKTHGYRLCG